MSIVDPEIVDPDIAPGVVGPIFSEPSASASGGAPGSGALLLGTFGFDSGTQRYAAKKVIHPDYVYEKRVLNWGFFDRSLAVPAGDYQGGDGRIRLADTDGHMRNTVSREVVLRRPVTVRMIREGTSESAVAPFLVQEIQDFEFQNAAAEVHTREASFTWMDKPINGLGNRTNFPDLMDGVDEFFFPILLGQRDEVSAGSPENPQGIVRLPRMTLSRWALSQTPMVTGFTSSSIGVVRKLVGDGEFSPVLAADYTITVEPHTIDGVAYSLSFLDFDVPQDPGAEVRLTSWLGNSFQGAWGVVASYDTTPVPTRNPIAILINLEYLGTANELQIPDYDTQSYQNVMDTFETVLGGSPATGYLCDVAITEPTTFREEIGKLCRTFEIDRIVSREGLITVSVILEDDPNAVVISDGPIFGEPTDNSLIIKSTVRQRSANPAVTRLRYNFAKNWATNEYIDKRVYNDTAAQAQLAGLASVRSGIIEATLNMDYTADPATAAHVISRRQDFLSLGSFRIEGEAPLPEVFGLLELGQLIHVTHRWGLEAGGYHEKSVKISGLVYDLMRRICVWRGVLRVPVSFGLGFPLACPLESPVIGEAYSAFLWPGQDRPLVWAVTGGALPEGLDLDAATGEISGTPLYAGTYNWTVTATDESYSPDQSQSISCQFDVQPEPACGLLTGEWRHNARVGPFYGPTSNEFWGVFVEDGRLVAKNGSGMAVWGTVDDSQAALSPSITSFDVQEG